MNKTFKKVSITLIICFFSASVLFVAAYFVIRHAERKEAERSTAEYESELKAYITENAEAFERLAAYEIENAELCGGEIDFYIQPIGELQEERNIVFAAVGKVRVLSDSGGSNPRAIFMTRSWLNDISVCYLPDGVNTDSEYIVKISDKLSYMSCEDPHYW